MMWLITLSAFVLAALWMLHVLSLRAKAVNEARRILGRGEGCRPFDQVTLGWGKLYTVLQSTDDGRVLVNRLWTWVLVPPFVGFFLLVVFLVLFS